MGGQKCCASMLAARMGANGCLSSAKAAPSMARCFAAGAGEIGAMKAGMAVGKITIVMTIATMIVVVTASPETEKLVDGSCQLVTRLSGFGGPGRIRTYNQQNYESGYRP